MRLGCLTPTEAIEGHGQIVESLHKVGFDLNRLFIACATFRIPVTLNQDGTQGVPSRGAIWVAQERKPGCCLCGFRLPAPIKDLGMIAMPNRRRLGMGA